MHYTALGWIWRSLDFFQLSHGSSVASSVEHNDGSHFGSCGVSSGSNGSSASYTSKPYMHLDHIPDAPPQLEITPDILRQYRMVHPTSLVTTEEGRLWFIVCKHFIYYNTLYMQWYISILDIITFLNWIWCCIIINGLLNNDPVSNLDDMFGFGQW